MFMAGETPRIPTLQRTRWFRPRKVSDVSFKTSAAPSPGALSNFNPEIWINYNDLTATSLEIMVNKGNHPKMAELFRLISELS